MGILTSLAGTNYEDSYRRAFEMADTSYDNNYDSGCQTVYVFLTGDCPCCLGSPSLPCSLSLSLLLPSFLPSRPSPPYLPPSLPSSSLNPLRHSMHVLVSFLAAYSSELAISLHHTFTPVLMNTPCTHVQMAHASKETAIGRPTRSLGAKRCRR